MSHVFNAFKGNTAVSGVALDISNNRLNEKNCTYFGVFTLILFITACNAFCKSLSECKNVTSLSMRYFVQFLYPNLYHREMDVPKPSLLTVITTLGTCHALTFIDLTGNFKVQFLSSEHKSWWDVIFVICTANVIICRKAKRKILRYWRLSRLLW